MLCDIFVVVCMYMPAHKQYSTDDDDNEKMNDM